MDKNKALKLALGLTCAGIILIICCAIALPWLVTWYVETKGRSQKLPAIIMVTCYPCVPFSLALLYYLRRFLKNIRRGEINTKDNEKCCNRMSVFCLIIAVITVVAGRFYLPFFLIGMSFAFFGLLISVIKAVILWIEK